MPRNSIQLDLPQSPVGDGEWTSEVEIAEPTARFRDRHEASAHLAARLGGYANRPDTLVLGLPRGGVPVAYDVARALVAPLDILLVRKLGLPGYEELAIGAIASGGIRVLNDDVVHGLRVTERQLEVLVHEAEQELARRERLYRGARPSPEVRDRTILLIDDGIATGATMRAAVKALRQQGPRRIVAGVPTAAPEACAMLRAEVDELVSVITPDPFRSVSTWYNNFSIVGDAEVRQLLSRAQREHAGPGPEHGLPAV